MTPYLAPEIKKAAAARKRYLRSDHRRASDFPQWYAGMSTVEYVSMFSGGQHHVKCPMHASAAPAPYLIADRVIVDEVA